MTKLTDHYSTTLAHLLCPASIGELMAVLGEATFTSILKTKFTTLFPVDYLTLVCFHRHERRHDIMSIDWLDHAGEVTEQEMAQYLARLWQMDPISELAKTITQPKLVYLTPEHITEPEYRHLFFGDGLISETCTWMGAVENRIYTVTIWRTRQHKLLSKKMLSSLHPLGDLLIPLISKHAELIPARRSTTQAPNILATLFDRRLTYQQIDISSRERDVCLGILFGRSLTQIAKEMNIKPSSATSYRDRAFAKLALKNNQALFTWCLSSTK